ncbi:hypothetical protein IMZ48_15125 [Candidatus Bathyarchaeota archaeon]|nr:hypothetical protein [Candidatus Bathyarchaeota archaeon]
MSIRTTRGSLVCAPAEAASEPVASAARMSEGDFMVVGPAVVDARKGLARKEELVMGSPYNTP